MRRGLVISGKDQEPSGLVQKKMYGRRTGLKLKKPRVLIPLLLSLSTWQDARQPFLLGFCTDILKIKGFMQMISRVWFSVNIICHRTVESSPWHLSAAGIPQADRIRISMKFRLAWKLVKYHPISTFSSISSSPCFPLLTCSKYAAWGEGTGYCTKTLGYSWCQGLAGWPKGESTAFGAGWL